jgi:hypothetical protein
MITALNQIRFIPFLSRARRFLSSLQDFVLGQINDRPVFGISILPLGKRDPDRTVSVAGIVPEESAVWLHEQSMALEFFNLTC